MLYRVATHDTMPIEFGQFERSTGINFRNKELLRQAFTHRSYINEHKRSKLLHNERLEFLGDAVLELVVTEYLYAKFPDKAEGELTSYRSALVNAVTLADVAKNLGMDKYLMLSKGESKDTGRARQFILANTFEALIGALFVDQGYAPAQKFIADKVFHLTDAVVAEKLWLDSKSHFQEKAQEHTGITPSYKTVSEEGPDHSKVFTVALCLGAEVVAYGAGVSKQEAEQDAARNALEKKGWM